MRSAPSSLRRIASGGRPATLAVLQLRSTPEQLRDLLEPAAHAPLLAAGEQYRALLDLVAAGNPLRDVMARLPVAGEATPTSAERGLHERAALTEAATGRALRASSPDLVRGGAISAPSPVAAVEGVPRAVGRPSAEAEGTWSREAAARELSDRVARAGLARVWSRPGGDAAPSVPVVTTPPPGPQSAMAEVVARRLAPIVQTVFEQLALRQRPGHVESGVADRRSDASGNAADALLSRARAVDQEERPASLDTEATSSRPDARASTPLRRLAALAAHLAQSRPGSPDTALVTEHMAPGAGSGSSTEEPGPRATPTSEPPDRRRSAPRHPMAGRVPSSVRPGLPGAGGREDERTFAEQLASVLRQEALRSGIDLAEFES